jgi:hypothetical protein
MGHYASIYIRNFDFMFFKSYIEPEIMTLFRETDRKLECWLDEDEEEYTTYKYSNTVKNIKLRLNIMGFTLENAEKDFNENNHHIQPYYYIKNDELIELELEGYTFKNWLEAMNNIINHKIDRWKLKDKLISDNQENTIEYFILDEHYDRDSLYGFKCGDFRFVLRSILELFKDDDECSLDYTDLIDGGYYEESDEISKLSLEYLSQNSLSNQKIIILTEGSSDISIIQQTMKVLYPDMLDYYSFMDFNTSNASGSASALVNYIKGFIGSGINNKIIALFDNDTAAYDAVKYLNRIHIPNNIKILHYPELEIAKDYPTLGPGGTIHSNINGLACSIELYLGRDILLNKDNNLTPIQWKGYNQSLNKYQGEILNKEQIIKRYSQLIKDIEKDEIKIESHDWDGMNKILSMIFTAFD